MQELIIEAATNWFRSLDFHLSRKGENYIFICEKLNIHINAISQEEFFEALTTQLLLKIEDIFNLKSWNNNIDLCSLFGIKKPESKSEVKSEAKPEKKPEPSAKTEEKPSKQENFEKWIKEEIEKAHKNGEFDRVKNPTKDMQDLLENWRTQKYNFPDYIQAFKDFPRFPWNQVICWEIK